MFVLPREPRARALRRDHQVSFVECLTVPAGQLEHWLEQQDDEHPAPWSQFRLEYLPPRVPRILDPDDRRVLSIVAKLLLRGRVTRLSPELEEALQANQRNTSPATVLETCPADPECFDDDNSEGVFFREVLPSLIGAEWLSCVTPQAHMGCLTGEPELEASDQRVDFVLHHPVLDRPVVIEIDGEQHREEPQKTQDTLRDGALRAAGLEVIRIPTPELEGIRGPGIDRLRAIGKTLEQRSMGLSRPDESVRLAGQVQVALFHALLGGLVAHRAEVVKVGTDLLSNRRLTKGAMSAIVDDFNGLVERVCALYGSRALPRFELAAAARATSDLFLAFDTASAAPEVVHISDVWLPFHFPAVAVPCDQGLPDRFSEEDLEYFLKRIFGHKHFRPGQYEALWRTLQGFDSIVLLPTGAGKSLVFQLAGLLLPGVVVVVAPIVSLIRDQVDNLRMQGLDRALGLTRDIGGAEVREKLYQLLQRGEYTFCYLAPERFQIVEFRTALRAMASHTPVAIIAIDEAHCVSEWGHDFRPAYLRIGRTTRDVSTTRAGTPPLLALTGTASRAVLKDVQRELGVMDFDGLVTPDTFNRAELRFVVQRCRSDEKMDFLDAHLKAALPAQLGVAFERLATPSGDGSYCGLVFCPHVNGEFGVTRVEEHLSRSLGIPSAAYASTAPKGWDERKWGARKRAIERQFKRNEIVALACTKAFGMGIDKPNIRYTVHFGFPASIEAFYQEAGRAGRGEGVSAVCCLLASNDFPERNAAFLSAATEVETVGRGLDGVGWDSADDVTRSLHFHTNSFAGVDAEVAVLSEAVQQLNPSDTAGRRTVDANKLGLGKIERALHRLIVLGIVADYTVDYAKKMLAVTLSGSDPKSVLKSYVAYVQTYQVRRAEQERVKAEGFLDLPWQEFVLQAARLYTVFVYEVIERGRRRALAEMLAAACESHDGEDLRQRILRYLESTEYSEKLEDLLISTSSVLEQVRPIAEDMLSPNEAAELRGQVGRYLESYPDQPSLLVLRALAEARCRDANWETVEDNIKGFVSTATRNYGVETADAIATVAFAIATVHGSNPDLGERLELEALERYGSDMAAPLLVAGAGEEVCLLSAWHVLNDLALRGLVAAGRDEINVRP